MTGVSVNWAQRGQCRQIILLFKTFSRRTSGIRWVSSPFTIYTLRFHRMVQTEVLKVQSDSIHFQPGSSEPIIEDEATRLNLIRAAEIIKTMGGVVAFPTETVYGLGGSSLDSESVKSIYAAKNRPADNPLISHVSSIEQLESKILNNNKIPEIYKPLIDKFWPGPLTILLPNTASSPLSPLVTADQPTFAVRLPSHPIARALIALSDTPIAAPSANASTRPSPTLASHVYHDLKGKIPMILDGGSCDIGLESTVIDGLCSPPMLLRPGGVSLEDIIKYGGEKWKDIVVSKKTASNTEKVRTPGMKYKHYSPVAKVVVFLNCGDGKSATKDYLRKLPSDLKIGMLKSKHFKIEDDKDYQIIDELGHSGEEIQRNLFAKLREIDEIEGGVDYIFVEGVNEDNEGLAIMNRLSKAAFETINGVQ